MAASRSNGEFRGWKRMAKKRCRLRLVPRKGRPFDLNVQWTFSPIASQTMVDVQEPKLVMNIAGPDEVLFGQSKLYRLTLSNPGTGKAENVAIDFGRSAIRRPLRPAIRSARCKPAKAKSSNSNSPPVKAAR